MSIIIFHNNVFQMSHETGLQFLEKKEILEESCESEQFQTIAQMCDIVINWPKGAVNWLIIYFPRLVS